MESGAGLFILFTVFLYWLALFVVPPLMIKRAIARVVAAFRSQQATEALNARTLDELGLAPGLLTRIAVLRDYRPAAIQLLMNARVVRQTFDGKVYLSERELKATCRQDRRNRLGLCELARG